ncbi:hypothetical protein BRARA_D00382 [Brassica rapa]|uniref:S-protein homolog n=2 Tax=Brassica TaxID=3705 RepID=A0A817AZY0_BRANA|nr:hypothetical protein BRARA_D00382 [Brassica rapa]CAF2266690.1 unnamed protein product [Brassica napus]CAG7905571.1 unnamed protein product [Brassica rapa]VDD10799.1 unnamed protein product [Brassica rapa]
MVFSNKLHCLLMFMISSFTLIIFASALDVSNVVKDAGTSKSGDDTLLPLARKYVVIHNTIENKQSLNVHCKSREDDLGMIHIPWNHYWSFRFHVNISKTTNYRCQFSWYGGGSHYFDIFKVSRDDTQFGKVPICKECIWEVRKESRDGKSSICRINRNGYPHYCFGWDNE